MAKIRIIRGKHVVDFYNARGERKKISHDSRASAERTLRTVKDQLLRAKMGLVEIACEGPQVHLADAIEQFAAGRRDRTNQGAERGYFTNFYNFLHHKKDLEFVNEVTTTHIDLYMNERLERVSPSTVKREIGIIRVFFRWCVGMKWVRHEDNPTTGLRSLRVKPGKRVRWTDEQVDLIMPVLPVWNRRIAAAIAMMAHRPSSLARMNWEDVAWNEQALWVHSWKNSGEGRKLIGLSDQALEFLRDLYLEAMKLKRAKPESPIFVNEDGQRFTVDNFCKVFSRVRDEVELPEALTAYALRHGFAQRLRKAGADVFAIKGLMGHSKLSTTEYYLETGIREHSEAANLAKAPLRLVN